MSNVEKFELLAEQYGPALNIAEIRGDGGSVKGFPDQIRAMEKLAGLRKINPQIGEVIESYGEDDEPETVACPSWTWTVKLKERAVVLGNHSYFLNCLPGPERYLHQLGINLNQGEVVRSADGGLSTRRSKWISELSVGLGEEEVSLSSWVYSKWLYKDGCLSQDPLKVLSGLLTAPKELAQQIKQRGILVLEELSDWRNPANTRGVFVHAVALPRSAIDHEISSSKYYPESFPENDLYTVYAANSAHHEHLPGDHLFYHKKYIFNQLRKPPSPVAVIFRPEPPMNIPSEPINPLV